MKAAILQLLQTTISVPGVIALKYCFPEVNSTFDQAF
jgi:hypothetical protein